MSSNLIAITGGIGSGKSVVSNILKILGFNIYDCDSRAKELIQNDEMLKTSIKETFGEIIINEFGEINRKALADIVFKDNKNLELLNSLVHPIVRKDILKWRSYYNNNILFFETAILKESKLDKISSSIIIVDAPIDLRIRRVMMRNNISKSEVMQRINNQTSQLDFDNDVYHISNDGKTPLIPQILNIVQLIKQ